MLLCNCSFCFAAIKRKCMSLVRNPTAPNRKIKIYFLPVGSALMVCTMINKKC